MLADLAGEIVLSVVGEAVVECLFPAVRKPQTRPQEGEWNASLGSVAAFLSAVAALFCVPAMRAVLRGDAATLFWGILGGSVLLAMFAGVLAYRALLVTDKRRTLASVGLWLSRGTIGAGLLAAAVAMLK